MADPVYLPDVNILVAAHLDASPFHALARAWLYQVRQFATAPTTKTGIVRVDAKIERSLEPADRRHVFPLTSP